MNGSGRKENRRLIRRSDALLILALIGCSLVLFGAFALRSGTAAAGQAWVRITRDGAPIGIWPLSADAEFTVPAADGAEIVEKEAAGAQGGNTVVIEDGTCRVSGADCPDKICVKQGRVSKNGETIVCLPHRLVIEVVSKEEAEVDAIAR